MKYKISLVLIYVLVILSGCGKEKVRLSDFNYITAAYVDYKEDSYIIQKCIDENTIIIVKNNKIERVIKDRQFVKPTEVMKLPELTEKYNIKEKTSLMSNTWKSTLDECSRYINYLEDQGYAIEFQANTEAFIEIYMINTMDSETNYKRLIITKEYIIESDLEKILFNSIENYII